jgi:hypothetical protein
MTVQSGSKLLKDTTKDSRHWSPFMLTFNTEDDMKLGSGDILTLSINPITFGYVVKLKNISNDNVYRVSDFVKIETLESMTESEINEKYLSILPAARTSYTNSTQDLFILKDVTGTYSQGIDMLPTLAYRFFNADGMSLLESLINKSKNFIQTSFTEVSTNVFEQTMKFKINNRSVNGVTYEDKQIIGGNINVILRYDSTNNVVPNYEDIVSWS